MSKAKFWLCKVVYKMEVFMHTKFYVPNYVGGKCTFGLPWWLSSKESACQGRSCRRHGFDPSIRKIPGAGSGNPLQYSCLVNPMDKGAWWAAIQRVTEELDMT